MKINPYLSILAIAVGLSLGACSKEEVPTPETAEVEETVEKAVEASAEVEKTVEKAVEETKEATAEMVKSVEKTAETVVAETKEVAKEAVAKTTEAVAAAATSASVKPLKIAYSDWPGWTPWEIAIKKGWFKEAGVEVEFEWMDYVGSLDAFAAGNLDGCHMTNGDALVIGTDMPSVCILINDYSNGNDMLIVEEGIDSVKDLKGKKIGLEEGFVPHLLVLQGLEDNGLTEDDIEIVNTPTDQTPQVLKTGAVNAICAWQPSSGVALREVPGSKAVYTSKDCPGLIYDCLYVTPESLKANRAEWMKVVSVWYKVVDFMKNEDNIDEVLEILAGRVSVTPDEYEPFLAGTYILTLDEVLPIWKEAEGLGSIYGSSKVSDDFNVKYEVYETPKDYKAYIDPSLTMEYAKSL